jgi:hypothetical protein
VRLVRSHQAGVTFSLRSLAHEGLCPACLRWVKKLWYDGDLIVCCKNCAVVLPEAENGSLDRDL